MRQTFALQRAWYSESAGLSKPDIQARIFDVVKSFEKVDPSKVSEAAAFAEDLGLDSLDAVEVVMAVEEEFGIEIPDAEADEIKTVQQAIDYIAKTPDGHQFALIYMMSPDNCITVDRPLISCNCELGEGPIYDDTTAVLHFVDIVKKQVLHFNTITSKLSIDQFEESVSCLALRRGSQGLACAAAQGFALIDPANSKLNYVSKPLPPDHVGFVRFNDGACDSHGRFFAGTIRSSNPYIPGQLYRYDPTTGSATLVDPGPFTDCNGLGWSADEKTMYLTDSLVNRIYAYDYNDGKLSNRRLFIDALALGLPGGTYPDGLCIDNEGCIWSARWGGSKIVRHSSDGSTILFEVYFPTALNITACCFGGANNDQLFVTTAHCGAVGGDASRQELYPDSGNVFQVDLSNRFKGGEWRHKFVQ
ncbi:hypothetical protein ACEPAG_349 [Sanghuangporus baumii]